MNPVPANDVASILSRVVESKTEYDTRLLAQQLGTNYRSLMYWLRGERPLPAHLLPRICILLNNCEVLDFLESQKIQDLTIVEENAYPRQQMRGQGRSEEHTSELQSRQYLVCRI